MNDCARAYNKRIANVNDTENWLKFSGRNAVNGTTTKRYNKTNCTDNMHHVLQNNVAVEYSRMSGICTCDT